MTKFKKLASNSRQKVMTKGALRNIADRSNESSLIAYFYKQQIKDSTPQYSDAAVLEKYLGELQEGQTIIAFNADSYFLCGADILFIQRISEHRYYAAGFSSGGERRFTQNFTCSNGIDYSVIFKKSPHKESDREVIDYDDDIIALLYDAAGCRLVAEFDKSYDYFEGEEIQISPSSNQQPIETKQENKKMTKISNVIDKNKAALITAGKIEAGNIVIKRISKLITPKLPMMVRGYADTPAGRLVLANIFNFAVMQYASQNKNAVMLADAALQGTMVEMLQSFNFNDLIDQVIDGVDVSKLTHNVSVEE